MALYELLPNVGAHVLHQGEGVFLVKEGVVESDRHLDKLFANKFRKRRAAKAAPDEEQEEEHTLPVIKDVKRRLNREEKKQQKEQAEIEMLQEAVEKEEEEETASPLGREVTDKFGNAARTGVRVFEKDGSHTMVQKDNDHVLGEGLSKRDVIRLIRSRLPEED